MLHGPDAAVLNAGKAALKALVKQHTQQYAAVVAEERRLQNEAADDLSNMVDDRFDPATGCM